MVAEVPFAVTAERMLREYPGLSLTDIYGMGWHTYLQLRAARYGRSIAAAAAER